MSPATTVTLLLWPQVRAEHAEWPWIFQPTLWRQSAALVKPDPFLVAAGTSQPISLPFSRSGICVWEPLTGLHLSSFPVDPETLNGGKRPRKRRGVCRKEVEGSSLSCPKAEAWGTQMSGSRKLPNLTRSSNESRGPVKVQEPLWAVGGPGAESPATGWLWGILNAGWTLEYPEMLWAYLWGQYLAFQCYRLGFSLSGWGEHGHLIKKKKKEEEKKK